MPVTRLSLRRALMKFLLAGGLAGSLSGCAVVAVVEGGNGGGTTCAPMARAVYQAILKKEHKRAG